MPKVLTCKHGARVSWCSFGCTEAVDLYEAPRREGPIRTSSETKQLVLNDVCDLLRIPRRGVSNGSSLPSPVIRAAARHARVPYRSMPQACAAIAAAAGVAWLAEYDSTGTASGGGSTVTLEGLQALRHALRSLAP